jgi:hypothetical protein
MLYKFRAEDWPEPILVDVLFLPSGVHAVSADGFQFDGSHEQWERFVSMGWAEPQP